MVFIFISLLLTGCTSDKTDIGMNSRNVRAIRDYEGTIVELPEKPKRILTLSLGFDVMTLGRSLVRIFLDQKTKAPGHIPYARVLGFQKNSAPLLSQIKKNSSIPLITKAADASAILDETALRLFNETCAASNLYEMLLCHKTGQPFIHEMKKPLRII